MKKRIAKVLLVVYLICQSIGIVQAETLMMDGKKIEYHASPISLYVNKKLVQTTIMDPIQLNNRVLVPAREVFESMGAKVTWDHTLKKVTVEYKNKNIILIVNQTTATINGESVTMDVPGKIINDKIMIPVRFVSEGIGMTVQWDSANRAVWIEEPVSNNTGETQEVPQISQITTNETNGKFVVTVTASSAMSEVKVSRMTGKVIIDIPSSRCLLSKSISPVVNTYVKSIRTSQFTEDTTRIVLDLKDQVELETAETQFSSNRQSLNITLTKKETVDNNTGSDNTGSDNTGSDNTGSDNTGNDNTGGTNNNTGSTDSNQGTTTKAELYVAGANPILNFTGVATNKIKVTDDYRNKTLIFDLGADYSKILPSNELKPNDSYVSSISVKTSGTTKVTVVTKKIYTYELSQSGSNTVTKLMRPREKYSKIVVIDIGHGGSDSGAVGNGLKEKDINFNQGMALYERFQKDSNFKVYLTRDTDVYPTLQFRSQLANEIDADLFVSIHNNSAASTVRGAETLYYPSSTDLRGEKIAALVQKSIVACGLNNRGIKPRSDLYVLNTTNMPAILLETGFISNAAEAHLINSSSFIAKWSEGVYGAIVEGFKYLQR